MVLSKSNVPGVVDLEDRDHIVAGAYREEKGAVVPGGRFATDADRAECDSNEAPEVDHSKEQSGWLGTLLSGTLWRTSLNEWATGKRNTSARVQERIRGRSRRFNDLEMLRLHHGQLNVLCIANPVE